MSNTNFKRSFVHCASSFAVLSKSIFVTLELVSNCSVSFSKDYCKTFSLESNWKIDETRLLDLPDLYIYICIHQDLRVEGKGHRRNPFPQFTLTNRSDNKRAWPDS